MTDNDLVDKLTDIADFCLWHIDIFGNDRKLAEKKT